MNDFIDRVISGLFTLIAEIGVNYYDIALQRNITPMEAAKIMCLEAKNSGIHAVKFQTYKAETLAVKDSPSYWDTSEESSTSQYKLFRQYDSFGEEEYVEIAEYCKELGIEFFSTAFDYESADYLDSIMNVYKISSSDITNIPFIEYQAKKNKPIILSVGASDKDEMQAAIKAIRKYNDKPLVLMHCVLEYPTPYQDANLKRISSLKEEFPDTIVGYSDHCKPDKSYDVIKTAFALGASVIEKHFTLDKTIAGNDHYHAMDPWDARNIISGIDFVDSICGKGDLVHSVSEEAARINARRSIVTKRNLEAGTIIVAEDLIFKRPGTGIPPSKIHEVVGKSVVSDLPADTIMQPSMMK